MSNPTPGAKPEAASRLRQRAETAAAALPPLLVAASRVAATVTLGSHGRRRAGVGTSFWQFRHYSKDDVPQAIDWRQTAKFDTVFVREREWVAAQTAALWCDTSPSMRYHSRKDLPTKAERAAVLNLALASLLIDGGERVIRLSPQGAPLKAAAAGKLALAQMAESLTSALETDASSGAFPSFAAPLPRHPAIVLISDFLAPLDEIAAGVRALARHGGRGHLLQVLDPAEETLPFTGRVRFVGLENEGMTVIDRAQDVRTAYGEKLATHREAVRALAAGAGWSFAVHRTDQAPYLALAALHNVMSEQRR
jgi:uncharacterized protein (DUF58 family)